MKKDLFEKELLKSSDLEKTIEEYDFLKINENSVSNFLVFADYLKDIYAFEEYLKDSNKSNKKVFLYGSIIAAKSYLVYRLARNYLPMIRDYLTNLL